MKLVAEAFAKVNRSLVVLGKRSDGFHELDTVFQAVGLTDRLTFEESDLLTLDVDDPSIPSGAENLVLRAARALAEAAGVRPRAHIMLEKRIPSGGGLGGGSSDAAVTLFGLSALWELDLPLELLSRVGGELGSDVPFFLHGGTARGLGRGERITPLEDLPPEAVVLVMPPFPVSTPEVFRRLEAPAWDEMRRRGPRLERRPRPQRSRAGGRGALPGASRGARSAGKGRSDPGPPLRQRLHRLRPLSRRARRPPTPRAVSRDSPRAQQFASCQR